MSENRARIFFGTELRRKREEAGHTGKELADALGCTPQWISTMESGRKVSKQSAEDLDTYFKTGDYFRRHWKLINEIEVQFVLPPGFPEYLEYEKKATSYRIFCALLVNGLLQTEDYTRSILTASDGANVSELMAKRMDRQAVLTRENTPHTWIVLDEAVLRRMVGGAAVMREQLDSLLAVSERVNTMLQVVPNSAGYHAGLGGSLHHPEFRRPTRPRLHRVGRRRTLDRQACKSQGQGRTLGPTSRPCAPGRRVAGHD